MTGAEDSDVMQRVAFGDRESIGILYGRYATVLIAVATRLVGNGADAEDVVHDLFVSLPERAKHYIKERGSVLAWLVILARNTSIDRLRRRRRAVQIGRKREAALSTDNPRDPESEAVALSAREGLGLALAALPATQRAVLEAAFFEGLTYQEIADREGIPLGTVKARCARALSTLRHALEQTGDEESSGEGCDPRG
jgi:RNA polymerase sigma-70 factor (ECF subfamily)